MTVPPASGTGSEDLRGRTVRGMGWNLVGVGLQVVLQAIVLVVLARLVTPEEFGVVAAALVVVNLLSLVATVGLGPALVQLRELTDDHVRVAFASFVLLGVGLWSLVTWQATGIAGLFGIPELAPVVPVIGSVLVLRNLTVGDWLLQRRLDFRRLAVLELQSYAVGFGLVAIGLAVAGHGLAAIVGGHVVQAAVRTMLLWRRAPHPVRPLLRRREARELLAFGGGHALGRLVGRLAVEGDNLVVARFLGPVALGLYGRAYQLMVMPSELVGGVANRVLFPSMAAVQEDRPRLGTAWLRSSVALSLVTVPLAVAGMVVAPELVAVVLGPAWTEVVPVFRVMAAGIVLRTAFKTSDAVVQATGHVYRRAARLGLYAAAVVVGALVGQRWGLPGVAAAVLGALVLHATQMTRLALDVTGVRWPRFARAHLPAVWCGVASVVVVWPLAAASRAAGTPSFVTLVVAAAGLAGTGVALVRRAPRTRGLAGASALVQDVLDASHGRGGAALRRVAGPGFPAHRPDHTATTREQDHADPDRADHRTADRDDRRAAAAPTP